MRRCGAGRAAAVAVAIAVVVVATAAAAAPPAASVPASAGASAAPAEPTYVLCGRPACLLVDRDGKAVMPRVFEAVWPLVGDLAVFRKGQRHGVVDRRGRTVLAADHASVSIGDDGRIWASRNDADPASGMLFDREGRVVASGVPRPLSAAAGDTPPPPAEVEILTTPQGKRLGDGHGRPVSEPFDWIYEPQRGEQSMSAMRRIDGRERWGQLFRDGTYFTLPEGTSVDRFRDGVAVIRVRRGGDTGAISYGHGLIDRAGRIVLAPTFEQVYIAGGGLVAVRRGTAWGLADTAGRVRVEPTFLRMDFSAHGGRIGATTVDRKSGVVDADGRWVLQPVFDEIGWVDDDLIAATTKIVDAAGRPDSRTLLFEADGRPWPGPPMRYRPIAGPFGYILAYDAAGAQVLYDRAGRRVAGPVRGSMAFELPDTPAGPYFVGRTSGFQVAAAYGGALSPRVYYEIHQQYRRGRAVADDSLLDERGQVLATYASAAPPGTSWPETLDPQVQARLDPCFNADVTEPLILPAPLDAVCASPRSRAMLKESQVRYHLRLGTGLDVDATVAVAEAFRARLLACAEPACAERELGLRLAALPRAVSEAQLSTAGRDLGRSSRRLPAALQRAILRQAPPQDTDGGTWSLAWVDLRRDGPSQVLGWNQGGGQRNQPFAIWARSGKVWKVVANDDALDVRVLPRRPRSPWPDLVVTQAQTPQWPALMLQRFAGAGYETVMTCTLAEEADTGVEMLCDRDLAWPAPSPPAASLPAR